jgi:sRNA-binding carbon storage regulator CsrA
MLVLRRKYDESVIIGDEVTLTVEEIVDCGDGRPIFGATVLLGFQTPRHVPICRSELLRTRGSGGAPPGRTEKPVPPRAGKLVEIADAMARLRIQVPPKIPVCCNGSPTAGLDLEESPEGTNHAARTVYHVSCRKEDRITICHNLTVAIFNFQRFVSLPRPYGFAQTAQRYRCDIT